ncbi:MAG TPA: DUF779 domain-containing protein [Streptosporangiaceae bacterium]|jgi:uncharacterized protein (DUF779 family)|nr:DUF779 domain-containing protein [Streptosporangiaceae bacterium]
MSEPMVLARITATPAAREAIRLLRAARGGPVMFVQSGGCCAGSTPTCFPVGEFLIGDIDVLLGEIDGYPFYIDKRLDQAWHQEQFLLDVASGEPEDFSLPAGDNLHFVARSPACASPSAPDVNVLPPLNGAHHESSSCHRFPLALANAGSSGPRARRG